MIDKKDVEMKKELLNISNQLLIISKNLENMDQRIKNIEEKTRDIHRHVPFVNWLEGIGYRLSRRISWLQGASPLVIPHTRGARGDGVLS
jgi:hypothetical protein